MVGVLIGALLVFNGFWVGLVVGMWVNRHPAHPRELGQGLHVIDPSGGESVTRLPREDEDPA